MVAEHRQVRRRFGCWAGALAVAAGASVLMVPGSAGAHAELVRTDPPAGQFVGPLPASITLHFSEGVDLLHSSVTVVGGDGKSTTLGPFVHAGGDNTSLTATVPASVRSGYTAIRWRSVSSDDGHVATGQYALTVVTPSVPATATAPAPAEARPAVAAPRTAAPSTAGVAGTFAAVRMLGYLALFVLCGGLAFLALLWPRGAEVTRARQVLYGAWLVGLVTSLLGIGLEGATINRKSLLDAISPSVIGNALTTDFGRVWACKGLLFLLVFPVLWTLTTQGERAVRGPAWKVGAAAVSIGLLRTPGLTSHTSAAHFAELGSVADLFHVIGIALWLGGLVMLCVVVLPRRRPDELARIVPGFSFLAMVSIGVAATAGTFMTWQLLGSVHALLSSHFGHVLLVKLGIFVGLIGTAQASKRWVNDRLNLAVVQGADVATVRPFIVSVALEVVLALGLLLAASLLVNTAPIH
jgi:copper transport protein